MVERNSRNADHGLGLVNDGVKPYSSLLYVGQHVAVRQHGTFGDTRRSSGVLQKGQIVSLEGHRVKYGLRTHCHCIA